MTAPILKVTEHAVRRLQVHVPKATSVTVRELVAEAETLSPDLVGALTRQWSRADGGDLYRLHRGDDGWGIFVVSGDTVVTYLRLSPLQVLILGGDPEALFLAPEAPPPPPETAGAVHEAGAPPPGEPPAPAPEPVSADADPAPGDSGPTPDGPPRVGDATTPWQLFRRTVERELDARLRAGPGVPRPELAAAFLAGCAECEDWGWLVTLEDGRRFRIHRRGNLVEIEALA